MLRKMPKIDAVILFLYMFSFFLTGFPVWQRGTRSANLHWHFLIFFLLLARLLSKADSWQSMFRQIILPSEKLTLFIFYSLIIFLISAFEFGSSNYIVSQIYCFAVISVVYSLYRCYKMEDIQKIIVRAYLVGLACILGNAIYQVAAIISFISGGGGVHPEVKSFVLGGMNLDSILSGMFAVFTMRKRYGIIVWCIGLAISVMYSSRAGMVVNIMVMMWYLVFVKGIKAKTIMLLLPAVAVIFAIVINSAAGNIIIDRFMNTSKDQGSGRGQLWVQTIEVIKQYPWGVGCGHVMTAVEKVNNLERGENNAHNIYLQYAAEQGIIFGSLFLAMCISWVLKHEFRQRFQNPFGTFIVLYFIVGIAQLTGTDTWIMIIAGSYFISRWQEKKGILDTDFSERNAGRRL